MKVAWTIDDAPSIASTGAVPFDPERMDRIRAVLQGHGVKHCTAFVIGAHATGCERHLERWIDAGYGLGNHTHEHPFASRVGTDSLLRSVEACDEVLRSVGAFDCGRPRWFRFPYLDRGADPESRTRIEAGLKNLGYQLAHGSIDTFDHRYEDILSRAQRASSPELADRVQRRYIRGALLSALSARLAAQRAHGRDISHVAFSHFGPVGEASLAGLLDALRRRYSISFVSLDEAMQDAAYKEFDRDKSLPGGPIFVHRSSLIEKVARKPITIADGRGWLSQDDAGPLVPHLCS